MRKDSKPINEFSEGSMNKLPTAIIRSVSFEKLKEGKNISQSIKASQHNIYQQLIRNKLGKENDNDIKHKNKLPTKNIVNMTERDKQLLRECTFKPQINNNQTHKRTLNQFIEHQMQFQKNKEDKIQQMRQILKENLQRENTFQPSLRVNYMKNNNEKEPVHNRLYQYSKQKQEKLNQVIEAELEKVIKDANRTNKTMGSRASSKGSLKQFNKQSNVCESQQVIKQNISLQRKSQHSIQKTSRRKKGVSLSRQNKQQIQEIQSIAIKKKNQQMCINKIFREIAKILTNLSITQSTLTYLQMSEILSQMKFISKNNKSENSTLDERKYLYDIWEMLQGDTNHHISLISLLKIIYAIIGCHDTQLVNQILENRIQIGKELQNLVLTEKDSKAIKNKFQLFYINRLKQVDDKDLQSIHTQYTFKPQISKISSQMAEKYRQRVIGESQKLIDQNLLTFNVPQNGQITHIDLLLLDEKRKEVKLKMQREQIQLLKKMEEQQLMGVRKKNLTILNENSIPHTSRDSNTSRFNQLYEHSKSNHRRDKSKDQVQAQKWSQQLTFKPQISTSYTKPQPNYQQNIPDFDKAIFRMYQGRRIKEEGHQKIQQNQLKTQNIQNGIESDDRNPILFLNVCMEGNENIKIPVFKNDNLETISSKVKIMLNIDKNSTNRELQEILRMQIEPVLKKLCK